MDYVIDRCFEYLCLKHLQISMRSFTMKVLEVPMDAWSVEIPMDAWSVEIPMDAWSVEVYKWFNRVYTNSSVLRIHL